MSVKLMASKIFSSQLTKIEQFIECRGQADNSTNYTVTESRSASPVVSWLPDVLTQLQVIGDLPDGWDSYDAPSPDINKLNAALGLLLCLSEDANVPKPYVNPTPIGSVQFEWEDGERYFELEIVAERAATYLYCDKGSHVEETGDLFEDESLESILTYIRKVASLQ